MSVLLLDTNVVSILFNRRHSFREACISAVAGRQLLISFMTRSELLLWPAANNWGESRRMAFGTTPGIVPDGISR
jgi:predicted nucleic acid-binding protein